MSGIYHLLNVDRHACEVTVFHCHLDSAAKSLWITHTEERGKEGWCWYMYGLFLIPERISLLLVEVGYFIQHSRVDSGIGITSDS